MAQSGQGAVEPAGPHLVPALVQAQGDRAAQAAWACVQAVPAIVTGVSVPSRQPALASSTASRAGRIMPAPPPAGPASS